MIRRRGTLFVVSAPSGAGKTTLCREMRQRLHDLAYSVSVTTRAPRPGEIDGSDFRFVSEPEFRAMLDRGELAEWATVHTNLYGTPAVPMEAALRDGRDVLLDIDTQGAAQLRARYPEAVLIFIVAPSMAELEQRLRERRSDPEREIAGRLERARHEVDAVAPLRLPDRESRRQGGHGAARVDHPGRALPRGAPGPHLPRPGGTELMAFPSLEEALNKVSNRYLLVVLSAKRARQLNRGAADPRRVQAQEAHQLGPGGDRGRQGRVPREGRGRDEGMSVALDGREIILGVTGSIAAYKAVYLLRELTRAGARVTVCLSEHAREFVGPLTFRTLSGRPVLTNLFDPQSDAAVEHVALAEQAAAVVVAPATANLLGKAAHGIADDFLTTLLLAARCPVVMAPAMDGGMWTTRPWPPTSPPCAPAAWSCSSPTPGRSPPASARAGRLPEVERRSSRPC